MAANTKSKRSFLSYERKKGLYGYGFLALWFVGALVFFIIPMVKSLYYSFCNAKPETGYFFTEWIGIQNYVDAFTKDPNYRKNLVTVLEETLLKTPLILIFSLFIAVILNQKFKGRTFCRAVFFLPVIIATGPVIGIINGDMSTQGANSAEQFSTMFETDLVGELLEFIGIYGINQKFTEIIQTVTSDIFNLVWNAGIQILIFLAALQGIPVSAKEAAQMEGATAWEFFWKITFPYVSPMILTNIVFTVIDIFTDTQNVVMQSVLSKQNEWAYGMAAAMAWAYFLIVIAAVGLITVIINRLVWYEVD